MQIVNVLNTYPEMLLDVVHLGPGYVSTVFGETSEGAVVTRIVVRIVAYIRVLTKGT
jgi:hypothetical protein